MSRSFKTQLAGQIGESLVVSELGRRGIVATAFAGNVPDIDLLAYRDGSSLPLQVKSVRSGSVSFDARRFMQIEFEGDRQVIEGPAPDLHGDLIYVFVSIGMEAGKDRFFVLDQKSLQAMVMENHAAWLARHGGVRPKNPRSTHTAVHLSQFAEFENAWELIEARLRGSDEA